MRMKTLLVGLVVLLVGGVSGCGELKPDPPGSDSVAVKQGSAGPGHHARPVVDLSKSSVLSEEDRKIVVARIGDVEITLGEYEEHLNDQPAYVRVRYNSLDKKKEFLDNLVRFELLAYEAKERGFDADADVVFAMKQAMIKKLMTEDVENLVRMADVTDADVQTYYDENPELFHKPEQVRVSQIVFSDKAAALSVHQTVTKQFGDNPRRKKQTFTEAVREHSVDTATRVLNGDTGFFTRDGKLDEKRGTLSEAAVQAAFALGQINALSPVVSGEGMHRILMLTNRRPTVEKSLNEVKRQIRNKLFRVRKDDAREQYIVDLRKKANVVVHEDVLIKVKDPGATKPAQPGAGLGLDKIPGVKEVQRMRDDAEKRGLIPTEAGVGKEAAGDSD